MARRKKSEICHAPWRCNKTISKIAGDGSRGVAGLSFCRDCYQYTFDQAQKRNLVPDQWPELIKQLPAPLIRPPTRAMRCRGPGCGEILPEGATPNVRRFVGRQPGKKLVPACRPCYERAMEFSHRHEGMTIEQAFFKMPPRQRRK